MSEVAPDHDPDNDNSLNTSGLGDGRSRTLQGNQCHLSFYIPDSQGEGSPELEGPRFDRARSGEVRIEYSNDNGTGGTFFVSKEILNEALEKEEGDDQIKYLLQHAQLVSREQLRDEPQGQPLAKDNELFKLGSDEAIATGIAALDVRCAEGTYTTSLRTTQGGVITFTSSADPCEDLNPLLRAGQDLTTDKVDEALRNILSRSTSDEIVCRLFLSDRNQENNENSVVTFNKDQITFNNDGTLTNSDAVQALFVSELRDFIASSDLVGLSHDSLKQLSEGVLTLNVGGQQVFASQDNPETVSLRLGSRKDSEALKVGLAEGTLFADAKAHIQSLADQGADSKQLIASLAEWKGVAQVQTAQVRNGEVSLIVDAGKISFEKQNGLKFSVEGSEPSALNGLVAGFAKAENASEYYTQKLEQSLTSERQKVSFEGQVDSGNWKISLDPDSGRVDISKGVSSSSESSGFVTLAEAHRTDGFQQLFQALNAGGVSSDKIVRALHSLDGVTKANYAFPKSDGTLVTVEKSAEETKIRHQNGEEFFDQVLQKQDSLKDYLAERTWQESLNRVADFQGKSRVSNFSIQVDGLTVESTEKGAQIVGDSRAVLAFQEDNPERNSQFKERLISGRANGQIAHIENMFAEKFLESESAKLAILDSSGNSFATINKGEGGGLVLAVKRMGTVALQGDVESLEKLLGDLRKAAEVGPESRSKPLLAALQGQTIDQVNLSLDINGASLTISKASDDPDFTIGGTDKDDKISCVHGSLRAVVGAAEAAQSGSNLLELLANGATSISQYQVGNLALKDGALEFKRAGGEVTRISSSGEKPEEEIRDLLGAYSTIPGASHEHDTGRLQEAVECSSHQQFDVNPPFPLDLDQEPDPTTEGGSSGGNGGSGGGGRSVASGAEPEPEDGSLRRTLGGIELKVACDDKSELDSIKNRLGAIDRLPSVEDKKREYLGLLESIFSDQKYEVEATFKVVSEFSEFKSIKVRSNAHLPTVRVDFESKGRGNVFDGGSFSVNGQTEKDGRLARLFGAFEAECELGKRQPTQIIDAIGSLKRPSQFNNVVLKIGDHASGSARVVKLTADPEVSNRQTVSLLDVNKRTGAVERTRLSFYSDTGLQTDIANDPLIAKLNLFGSDAKRAVSTKLDIDQRDALLLEELTRDARQIVLREANLDLKGMQHPDGSTKEADRTMRIELDGEKYIVTFRHQGSWQSKDEDYLSNSDKETRAQFENTFKLHALSQAILKETGKTTRPNFSTSPAYLGFMADKRTNNILLSIAEHAEKVEKMWFKLPDSKLDPYPKEIVQQQDREIHVTYDEANKKNQIFIDGKLSGAFRDATCIVNGTQNVLTDTLFVHDLYNNTIAGESDDRGYKLKQHEAAAGRFGHRLEVEQKNLFSALKDPLVRVTDLGAEPGLMEKTILRGGAYPLNFTLGLRRGPNEHDIGLVEFYTDGTGYAHAKFHAPKGGNALHPEPVHFVFRDGSAVAGAVDAINKFNKDVEYPPHRDPGTGEKRIEDLFLSMSQLGGEVAGRTEVINANRRAIELGPNRFEPGKEEFSKRNSPIKSAFVSESNGISLAVVEVYQVGRSGEVGAGQTKKVTLRLEGNTQAGMKAFNEALIAEREFHGDPRKSEFFSRMSKGGWRFDEIEEGAHLYLTSNSNVNPDMTAFVNLKKFEGTIHMFSPNFHELQITGENHGYQKLMTAKFISNERSGKPSHMSIDFLSDEFSDGIVDAAKAFRTDMYTESSARTERGVLYIGTESEVENLMWRAINSNQVVAGSGCNMQLFLRKTISKDQDFSNLYLESCIMEVVYEGGHIERLKHDNVNRLLQRLAPKSYQSHRAVNENSVDFIANNLRTDMVISDVRLGAIQVDSAKSSDTLSNLTVVNCQADRLMIGHKSPLAAVNGLMVTGCEFFDKDGITIRARECGFGNAIVNSKTENITIDASKINGLDLRGTSMPAPNLPQIDAAYQRSMGFWPDPQETQAYQKYLQGVVFSPGLIHARNHVERTRLRNIKRTFKWWSGFAWYMNPNLHVQYGASRIPDAVSMMDKSKARRDESNSGTILGGSVFLSEEVRGRGVNNQVIVGISGDQASRHPGLKPGRFEVPAVGYVAGLGYMGEAAKNGDYGAVSRKLESLTMARYHG